MSKMSKIKKIILQGIIIYMILTVANISLAETATVSATAVRIRESASTSSNIITNVYQDDEVEILEENGEWYKVKVGEKEGFAKAEFFKKKTTTSSNVVPQNTVANETKPQNTTTPNQTATTQNTVPNEPVVDTQQEITVGQTITLPNATKIRLIPNLSTSAKTEIPQGTSVTIEANLGNWYKITNQTVSGWVTMQKLTALSNPAEPAPESTPEPTQPVVPEPEPVQNTTPAPNTVPEQTVEQPKEPEQPAEQEKPTEPTTSSNRTAVVIVETARVRKGASKKAEILDVLDEDDIVTIIGEEGDFYKITSRIGSGYISKSLVKEKDVTSRGATEQRANVPVPQTNENVVEQNATTVTGSDIVAFAKQYLGYPYVLRLQYARKRL